MALSEAALLTCYQRLEKPLYNILFRMLWHKEDSQDVIHEAFLKVWATRDTVDESRLDALMYHAALNLARNRIRWRMTWLWEPIEVLFEHASDAKNPEQLLADGEVNKALRSALRALPSPQREALLLTEFSELSLAEAAEVLNIPAGTVGSRRHLAIRRLRALWKEQTP